MIEELYKNRSLDIYVHYLWGALGLSFQQRYCGHAVHHCELLCCEALRTILTFITSQGNVL